MGKNSSRKRDNIIPFTRKDYKDLITCVICNAKSYMKEELMPDGEFRLICKACGEDNAPYLEALKEFNEIKDKQEEVIRQNEAKLLVLREDDES